MNKKKAILPLVLVLVLVVLIVGKNLYSSLSAKAEAKKEAEAEAEEEANTIRLCSASDVSVISIDGLEFSYSDAWEYAADPTFPLKTTTIETIASAFKSLTAVRSLTAAESLENYGLETPSHTIILTDADGVKTTFYIGTKSVDSYYYVMLNDDQTNLYTCSISAISYVKDDLYDYASLESITSLWSGKDTLVKVASTDNTITFSETEITTSEEVTDSDGNTTTETTTKTVWNVEKNADGAFLATDEDAVDDAIDTLAFTFDSLAGYNVTSADYAAYKLDQPLYTVEITYTSDDTEKTLTIYIGQPYDDTNTCVMTSESQNVYFVDTATISDIESIFSATYLTAEETEDSAE